MKKTDIESFLKNHKPHVKENPAFLLEAQQKMRAVDGVKSEVDRQRQYGRITIMAAIIVGLIAGLLIGVSEFAIPEDFAVDAVADIKVFINTWKPLLLAVIPICAIVIGLLSGKSKSKSTVF